LAASPPSGPDPGANPLLAPQFLGDPYPVLGMLRQHQPVFRIPTPPRAGAAGSGPGEWLLTRHADVQRVLREPCFSAERERAEGVRAALAGLPDDLRPDRQPRSMLGVDPPEHTRLRTLVSKAFTPRRIRALGPAIEALAQRLLDEAAGGGQLDVIHDFAAPLPAMVIADLLGVPPGGHRLIKRWSDDLVATLDGPLTADRIPRIRSAREAFAGYFERFIAERRREPRDDLISAMIRAQEDRDALSDGELLATANLLLVAGHETTTNLIGNGLHALLQHPDELERLRRDPALDASALEECLRFDGPVQVTARVATEEVEIRGQRIGPGALVTVSLGAANRDPEVFEAPERLDVGRTPNPHLGFGHGVHFCLGANLARLEGRIALRVLLDRLPDLRLAAEPERRPSFVLRGFRSLRVAHAA